MKTSFLSAVTDWLQDDPRIVSAVLFGSSARESHPPFPGSGPATTETARRADLDLHIITTDPVDLEQIDWASVLPSCGFVLQVARPATGDVRKVTALFDAGELDLVLVPADRVKQVRAAMAAGRHRTESDLRTALNEVATCLHTGHRFLKGETEAGGFYRQILDEMPGVRLSDAEARSVASLFLCEYVWVMQKIERGELRAAQLHLHRFLSDANFRLLREMRLRRGEPLPSFGLARRAEQTVPFADLEWVTVSARLDPAELTAAARKLRRGLEQLMGKLDPAWAPPARLHTLLPVEGGVVTPNTEDRTPNAE